MIKILNILFILVAILAIGSGKFYWDHRIEAQKIDYQKQQAIDNQKEKEHIAFLKENRFNSVVDWMKYKSTQKDKLTISVFGSSVTNGTGASTKEKHWTGLLVDFLSSQDGMAPISLKNSGFGGYNTQRLIKENRIKEVIESKPDLIIIEPTIINNYGSSVSMDQTKTDVLYFLSEIKKKLPNSLVVLQSSNPINPAGLNNTYGYSYSDYAKFLNSFCEENDLNYVDIYSGVSEFNKKNNKQLNDILSDNVHPNDLGYRYWFETLKTAFEKNKLVKP